MAKSKAKNRVEQVNFDPMAESELKHLMGLDYSKEENSQAVMFSTLPEKSKLRLVIDQLFMVFTGKHVQSYLDGQDKDGLQVGYVSTEEGGFKAFYGPSICKVDDQAVIAFGGGVNLPIPALDMQLTAQDGLKLADSDQITLDIRDAQRNGYSEPHLVLTLFLKAKSLFLDYYFPLKFAKWDDHPKTAELASSLKADPDEILEVLGAPGSGSSALHMAYLVIGQEYLVTNYEVKKNSNPKYGKQYVLEIDGSKGGTVLTEKIKGTEKTFDTIKVNSSSQITKVLNTNPNISPENPGILTLHSAKERKDGKGITTKATLKCDIAQQTNESLASLLL